MSIKDYFVPKSMVYTGEHTQISTKIIHYHYNDQTIKMTNNFKPLDGFKHYIQVIGLSDVKKIQQLNDYYTIDPLIIEDVFNVKQRNKIEFKDQTVFGVFHVEYLKEEQIIDDYLSLIYLDDTVISFHETEPEYLRPLYLLFEQHKEVRERSSDYLLYQILDIITDAHLDVFEHLDHETTMFEEEILESKNVDQETFYLLRKRLLKLKNNVAPALENIDKAMSRKPLLFQLDNMVFFEDLKDHLVRLDNQLNLARELMRHLLDLHINNQSNKMNRIMTTLTLFSAIFIPLSFLTGFFGMNFIHFGILEYEHALGIFVGLCLLLAVFMVLLFKRMKWF